MEFEDILSFYFGATPQNIDEVKGFPLGTIVNGKAIVWDGKLIEKANGKPLKF